MLPNDQPVSGTGPTKPVRRANINETTEEEAAKGPVSDLTGQLDGWIYVKDTKPQEKVKIIVESLRGKEIEAVLSNGVYLLDNGGFLYLHDVKRYKIVA